VIDCADVLADISTSDSDPRLDEESVCCIPGSSSQGTVVLVGVVHDHPASVARVAHLLDRAHPDVVAVELPPLAVPLFELYAQDTYTPPRLGGEMSMAIKAADATHVVGIDTPSRRYLRVLGDRVFSGSVPREQLYAVFKQIISSYSRALLCWLAAPLGEIAPVRPRVYSPLTYESTSLDSPEAQAAHERKHRTDQLTFLRAIEPPPVVGIIDSTREEGMVKRSQALRSEGDVVAVVGMEHLDELHSGLK
jgi:pheromone shutdown protein TraB